MLSIKFERLPDMHMLPVQLLECVLFEILNGVLGNLGCQSC